MPNEIEDIQTIDFGLVYKLGRWCFCLIKRKLYAVIDSSLFLRLFMYHFCFTRPTIYYVIYNI